MAAIEKNFLRQVQYFYFHQNLIGCHYYDELVECSLMNLLLMTIDCLVQFVFLAEFVYSLGMNKRAPIVYDRVLD